MDLSQLDERQLEAVTHPDGPLLVVAGPGSGKTRVLTHRVGSLIDRGVAPSKILAITFTNKAAGEMRERLSDLVDASAFNRLWVSTFHAACAKILRIDHEAAGLPKSFAILDVADTSKILRGIVTKLGAAHGDAVKDYIKTARGDISRAKNHGIPIAEIESHSKLDGIYQVASAYTAALQTAGAVDFDDLLLRTRNLFQSDTDAAQQWADRFEHVLVDEFQDTNPIQMDLVRHLTKVKRNLCAVGDLDQSVYKFRAADPKGMSQFTDEWPDANVVILDRNYRSTPQIVEVSASIISPNPARHRAEQHAHNTAGDTVQLREFRDDRDEARFVADTIKTSGQPLRNFAALVRTNAQTRSLEDALSRAGLQYQLVGTVKFYDRAEVKDALAWMRSAVHAWEPISFERATSCPRRGIGPSTITAVREHAERNGSTLHVAAHEVAAQGGRGASALDGFITDLLSVRTTLAEQGPVEGLKTILSSGVQAHWSKGADKEERLANLEQLVSAAAEFVEDGVDTEGNRVSSLSPADQTVAFLNNVSLVSAADNEDANSVTLLTIHASKGREFHTVFVVGLEEKLLPHSRAYSTDDIQEERRLLYVATSRAQSKLFLSHAGQRFAFGKVVTSQPSRFLADLPASVQKVRAPARRIPHEPQRSKRASSTSSGASGGWESNTRQKFREERERRRKERGN